MEQVKLAPCPVCGSPPGEEWWGAASEIYGTCWQSGSLDCSNKDCFHGVQVEIDSDIMRGSTILEDMWNLVATGPYKK